MKLRDRADRNLMNIRYVKQKSGRVPKGMRISVTPEWPTNEDPKFCQDWARALSESEEILCRCLELHLKQLIIKIDRNICVKVNQTLEIIDPLVEGDPLVCIKETLTKANEERAKINETIRKRENNGKTANDSNSGPPNKKHKKNDKKDNYIILHIIISTNHDHNHYYLVHVVSRVSPFVQPLCLGLTISFNRVI